MTSTKYKNTSFKEHFNRPYFGYLKWNREGINLSVFISFITNIGRAAAWIPKPNRPQSLASPTGHKDNAGWMSRPSRVDRTTASYIIPGLRASVRNSCLLHTHPPPPSIISTRPPPPQHRFVATTRTYQADRWRVTVWSVWSLASPRWVWPSDSRQLNFQLENCKSVLFLFWPSLAKC